jgi:hypothetical protein
MSYASKALAAASALLMGSSAIATPLVLEGNYVKIGVNDAGTVGSGGNTSPGILYDSTGTATFNPSYDYLTPGSPFEGWTVKGIDTDGTTVLFNYGNNNASYASVNVITGTLVDYSGVSYRGLTFDNRAVWSGSVSEFDIEHDYRFNDNQQFVDINTRLEFKMNVPTLYFGRFTDPDARAAAGDSSSTLNVRGYAGGVPATNVVLSEALASKYALGLFTAATNSNTGISAGWSTDPIDYYNGVDDGDGDYTIGVGFMFSGINTGDIIDIQYAYIFGPSSYDAASGAVAGGAGGATSSSFTITDVGSASAPTTSAPTVTGTTTTNTVTTSTSTSATTSTSYVTRTETSTDIDGNPVVRTYTDTVVTTTPVDTTTTTTTPVTTTTYSDGSTTTTTGTPVVTYSSVNGSPTSTVTGTALDSTAVTRPSIVTSNAPTASLPVVRVSLTEHDASENDGVQKIDRKHTTSTTTGMTRTIVNTPVTTTTDASGNETVTNGTPTTTYEFWNDVNISYAYDSLTGRVDQHEVMGAIGEGLQGLLNHEPSEPTTDKVRVFSKNYYAWSSADNGYTGKSVIYGGGLEIDIKPTWTIGAQYNNVNVNLDGVDSTSKLNKSHIGVFNMLRGNTLSLLTNAAIAQNRYNVSRTVQGIFNNESSTTGQEWWVNNRLFWHAHKNITPFVGYTVRNYRRDAFTESGSIQSARSVDAVNETYHTGEIGLTLSHRFGGKKNDMFGVSVEGSYATDNSVEVATSVDYKEIVFIEGVHQILNGVSNTAVSAKVKFRF